MPFTISHAAAILPLRYLAQTRGQAPHAGSARHLLRLDALVIGSFSPDLPYFLGVFQLSSLCHGRLWSVLPATLVAATALLLWRAIRPLAIRPLPEPYRSLAARSPISVATQPNLKARCAHGVELLASLMLGAATHIFWDSWTHRGGYFVQSWSQLRADAMPGLPIYNALQHASSVLGLAVVVVAIAAFAKRQAQDVAPNLDTPRLLTWLCCAAVGLFAFALRMAWWPYFVTQGLETRLFHAIVLSINAIAITWMAGAMALPREPSRGDMLDG